jgi:hypothetical protein
MLVMDMIAMSSDHLIDPGIFIRATADFDFGAQDELCNAVSQGKYRDVAALLLEGSEFVNDGSDVWKDHYQELNENLDIPIDLRPLNPWTKDGVMTPLERAVFALDAPMAMMLYLSGAHPQCNCWDGVSYYADDANIVFCSEYKLGDIDKALKGFAGLHKILDTIEYDFGSESDRLSDIHAEVHQQAAQSMRRLLQLMELHETLPTSKLLPNHVHFGENIVQAQGNRQRVVTAYLAIRRHLHDNHIVQLVVDFVWDDLLLLFLQSIAGSPVHVGPQNVKSVQPFVHLLFTANPLDKDSALESAVLPLMVEHNGIIHSARWSKARNLPDDR